ncbi:Protein PHYLLO, chloroplastic [Apostasia shenzhenica]|uniref:soluble epoxide hydrolase n=1 Tax=Apostasia shenzhenica TaxID=1088818 RepID=A0A2I0AS89_9ASPA|nr:Protein PHYLLO, chloroplastic [Apostasia shenzhenica]
MSYPKRWRERERGREREREGEMDGGIEHRFVEVNGIRMHVAEKGQGPAVLFIHGFPELWYSWRHQIVSLAARGYRAVAPDLRGFGDTDAPPDVAAYSIFDIVGDLVALIESLGEDKVFVVGHNWGATVAWNLCVFRPDKVKALVNMSVAFSPRNPVRRPVDSLRAIYGDDLYICRFQEPGEAEADFARLDTAFLIKKFLTYREPAPLLFQKGKVFGGSSNEKIILPSWLTEDDINYFASKFENTGFTGGFNYYRNLNRNWELSAPWTGVQVKVPVKFMVGDLDQSYHFPRTKDYVHKGGFKRDVPFLQDLVVMEGVGHFINQERPNEVSDHIYEFINRFS